MTLTHAVPGLPRKIHVQLLTKALYSWMLWRWEEAVVLWRWEEAVVRWRWEEAVVRWRWEEAVVLRIRNHDSQVELRIHDNDSQAGVEAHTVVVDAHMADVVGHLDVLAAAESADLPLLPQRLQRSHRFSRRI